MVTTISSKLTSLLLAVLKHFKLLALTIPFGTEVQVIGLSKMLQILLKATALLVEPTLTTEPILKLSQGRFTNHPKQFILDLSGVIRLPPL